VRIGTPRGGHRDISRTSFNCSNLYYVDPMHPANKSDKPGVAPDWGMTLEPVYADDVPTTAGTSGRKTLYYRDRQYARFGHDRYRTYV